MMKKPKAKFLYVFILIFGILFGCSSESSNKKKLDSIRSVKNTLGKRDPAFNAFLKKFKHLSLPLTIKTSEIVTDAYKKLDNNDNVFIKYPDPGSIYAYGILPDTLDTFKIIWLQPADDYIPILTTFTKSGKKISSEYLGVGGCGTDCCFECSEFVTITKDLYIFAADSIKSCECDSTGPKVNTTTRYVQYKTGKILKNGKITIGKDMTKVLQKAGS